MRLLAVYLACCRALSCRVVLAAKTIRNELAAVARESQAATMTALEASVVDLRKEDAAGFYAYLPATQTPPTSYVVGLLVRSVD